MLEALSYDMKWKVSLAVELEACGHHSGAACTQPVIFNLSNQYPSPAIDTVCVLLLPAWTGGNHVRGG